MSLPPKLISIKFLLVNGIDPKEYVFTLRSNQSSYDTLEVGNYVLLQSKFQKNAVSVGRITKINESTGDKNQLEHLSHIICMIDINELELIEGLEIKG
jgi:hypothetical protein